MNANNILCLAFKSDKIEQRLIINLEAIKDLQLFEDHADSAKHTLLINYIDGTSRNYGGESATKIYAHLKNLLNPTPIFIDRNLGQLIKG